MKLQDLQHEDFQEHLRECEVRSALPYKPSPLAEPPITYAEVMGVDFAQDTSVCWWHKGEMGHLREDGKVYFCPVGKQYYRHQKWMAQFFKPLA